MKALISPDDTQVSYISSWTVDGDLAIPVYSNLPNCVRIAQVEETEFDVSPPLFWLDCNASVNAVYYCYDTSESVIKLIPNAPNPLG